MVSKIPDWVQIKSQPLANKILGYQIKPLLLVEILLFRHEIKTTPYLVKTFTQPSNMCKYVPISFWGFIRYHFQTSLLSYFGVKRNKCTFATAIWANWVGVHNRIYCTWRWLMNDPSNCFRIWKLHCNGSPDDDHKLHRRFVWISQHFIASRKAHQCVVSSVVSSVAG